MLQRPDFVTSLRKRLPTDPSFPGLIVEITEDEAIRDPQLAREIAVQLRLYNVHVSIDDFGSGYSSLARFQEVPFKEIKLDRSYVRGAAEDESKREMCRVVADLARRFQITSVAEGAETKDDLGVLIENGYDLVQGFFFAKPMPCRDFMNYVAADARKGCASPPRRHRREQDRSDRRRWRKAARFRARPRSSISWSKTSRRWLRSRTPRNCASCCSTGMARS